MCPMGRDKYVGEYTDYLVDAVGESSSYESHSFFIIILLISK